MNQKPNSYNDLYPPPDNAADTPTPQPFVMRPEEADASDMPQIAPGVPATPPQPFIMRSDEVDTSVMPQRPPVPPSMVRAVPPKPKTPFSPIPLLLIAGVAFLFLGGIIFLTNTWDMLPDAARAISLLSASFIAFGANVLAERVFKLPKTGLAFYILGCIFLPMAVAGIGAFQLMGEWFSFDGDGAHLVMSLIFVCVAAPALFGEKHYQSRFLAWLGLAGITGSWTFLAVFISMQLPVGDITASGVAGGLFVLFAVGAAVWSEWYLRRKKDTPICKIMVGFLYPMLVVYSFYVMVLASDLPLTAAILAVVLAALFLNSRFIVGKLHGGIFGFLLCLLTALAQIPEILKLKYNEFEGFLFVTTAASVLLMSTFWLSRKVRPELAGTFSVTGLFFAIPLLCVGSITSCADIFIVCLYGALFIGMIFFLIEKKNPFSRDTKFFCMHFTLLFLTACLNTNADLFTLLLVASALLLMVEAFLGKKLWPLALAIGSCGSVLVRNLPNPLIWLCWLCTAGLLAGVIYSHISRRQLLEKCCAWAGISFLLASLGMTLDLWVETLQIWSLLLAVVTLLYLLETVVFWKHSRSEGTGRYLEILSLFVTLVAFIAFVSEKVSGGWGFLLVLMMLIFTGVFVNKPKNALSIPYLIMLFFTANHMVAALEDNHIIANENWLHMAQIGCFILILAVFAGMGRLLLPDGFFDNTDGRFQVDWPLLAGVLPVFAASETIDWYPALLTSLFLSLYSLLYIGRVKNRRIPALLATFFGCMTIFFHNVYDPWSIMERLRELDIKTPQILLYLLPMHLFILSLLWILPKQYKSGVHVARFCMYCFTMLCLLVSSFSFGHVTDALILVAFSFAILVGSFSIKRLRWFTLGFAVLVVMTFRLTRMFWQSLHWSIYLFLAGAVLIGIASAYELNARKQAEHPEEPKKKFKPFSSWRW